MSDLRAGLRALITEYGRDGGNDDIDNIFDRAIALIRQDGVLLSREEAATAAAVMQLSYGRTITTDPHLVQSAYRKLVAAF